MSKEDHNKTAKVENLLWEIAKILNPNSIIEKERIEEAKKSLLNILNDK